MSQALFDSVQDIRKSYEERLLNKAIELKAENLDKLERLRPAIKALLTPNKYCADEYGWVFSILDIDCHGTFQDIDCRDLERCVKIVVDELGYRVNNPPTFERWLLVTLDYGEHNKIKVHFNDGIDSFIHKGRPDDFEWWRIREMSGMKEPAVYPAYPEPMPGGITERDRPWHAAECRGSEVYGDDIKEKAERIAKRQKKEQQQKAE